MHRPFLIVQHAEAEGPGLLAEPLAAAGYPLRLVRTDRGEAVPEDAGGLAGIVVMGGSMGVADALRHPHVAAEIALLRRALADDLPILGICLGAQILAAAAGARIYAGPEKEIGWEPITLTEAGRRDPVIGAIPDGAAVFHWHGDTFDLPPGAPLLASSARYRHQAFRSGPLAWGLQFHVEVTPEMVDDFLAANAGELAGVHGAGGGARLSAEARRFAPLLAPAVPRLVEGFLRAAGSPAGPVP